MDEILDRIPYDCDVLIHCGDFTINGYMQEFAQFARSLGKIKNRFDLILVTPGNHDFVTQKESKVCKMILKENGNNIHMLIDEEFIYKGLKFYMSPWTPRFYDWAWMYNRDRGKIIWNQIPNDTDILITHGMPEGILDSVANFNGDRIIAESVGCSFLRERIKEIKPKIYAGGHLHFNGGKTIIEDNTLFINAAICDEQYNPDRSPIIVEIDEKIKLICLK